MLLQGDEKEMELLPALPEPWGNGCVKGIRARGGHTLAFSWQDGGRKVVATIMPGCNAKIRIVCGGSSREVKLKKGKKKIVTLSKTEK